MAKEYTSEKKNKDLRTSQSSELRSILSQLKEATTESKNALKEIKKIWS